MQMPPSHPMLTWVVLAWGLQACLWDCAAPPKTLACPFISEHFLSSQAAPYRAVPSGPVLEQGKKRHETILRVLACHIA